MSFILLLYFFFGDCETRDINGQLVMVPEKNYVHEAIVLNNETGLIGLPQQKIEAGVNVRCLINPNIQINGLIRLDQAFIYRTMLPNSDIAMGYWDTAS